jgi:hypothetical protein
MNSIRRPVIAYNTVADLRPELIGVAAWLGVSSQYPSTRHTVLEYLAEHGTLAGCSGLSDDDRAAATRAHEEWTAFLAQLEPAKPYPYFRGNHTNGHAASFENCVADIAGVNGQESPDGCAF